MYTFIISILFFVGLSALILGKNFKKKQLIVWLIVFGGTLVSISIVNGILGFKIPFTKVLLKEEPLYLRTSKIYYDTPDTVIKLDSVFIKYITYVHKKDTSRYIDESVFKTLTFSSDNIKINVISDSTLVPKYRKYKEKRITTSNWIIQYGLPAGDLYWEFDIPKDSIHLALINYIKIFNKNANIVEK